MLCDGGASTIGLTRQALIERVRSSAALINVMGFLNDEEILASARRRVFLDIDPGFGQMWHALGLRDMFHGHDAYVTIAENIGQPSCGIPTCGLDWITTRQPVVLDEWPAVGSDAASRPITSVVSWRGAYGPVTYAGRTYGLRAREFRKFATLPQHCEGRFELALDIHAGDAADVDLLRSHGWSLVAPGDVAGDPWRYRRVHRSIGGRDHDRQGHVRRHAQRLDQRPQHLLPRQRAAGPGAGHRARQPAADDRRAGDVYVLRRGDRRGRAQSGASPDAISVRRAVWPKTHFESSLVLGALVRKLALN